MSLENLNNENQIINIYNRFCQKRTEYNQIDARHQEEKNKLKTELASVINQLKAHHCYNESATDEEKTEMDAFLEELVPLEIQAPTIGGVDVL